jgi:hypothetical protein|tara:strand:- start:1689 stop:1844 length:156 start_codon:yes stop_codon:yes gene_type:complete
MGKGSAPRPFDIKRKEFADKFDSIDWSNTKDASKEKKAEKKNENKILPRSK